MAPKKGGNETAVKGQDENSGKRTDEKTTSELSSTKLERYGLWKFNGTEYESWKFVLQLVLKNEDLADVLDCNAEHERADEKKDCKAMLIIAGALHSSHLMYAKNATCAGDVIRKLDDIYLQKGTAGRVQLRTEWQNLKMEDNGDLERHLRKFDQLTSDLENAGVRLSREDVVDQLLMSMPKSYEVTVQVMESMEKLTLEVAKGKLRN